MGVAVGVEVGSKWKECVEGEGVAVEVGIDEGTSEGSLSLPHSWFAPIESPTDQTVIHPLIP